MNTLRTSASLGQEQPTPEVLDVNTLSHRGLQNGSAARRWDHNPEDYYVRPNASLVKSNRGLWEVTKLPQVDSEEKGCSHCTLQLQSARIRCVGLTQACNAMNAGHNGGTGSLRAPEGHWYVRATPATLRGNVNPLGRGSAQYYRRHYRTSLYVKKGTSRGVAVRDSEEGRRHYEMW